MRQKDFIEVARILGNEGRLADDDEIQGIVMAHYALVGHAEHAYPEVDTDQIHAAYMKAYKEGL